MSGTRRDATGITVGGEPRIDFLPPEVKAGKEAKKTRRSLFALVLLVVAVCVAGYVFAASLAVQARGELAAAQDRTRTLIQEQGKYQEARTVSGQLSAAANARLVGSANEVLWRDYLIQLVAALPAGTAIESYAVTSQAATDAAPVPSIPLQNARIATINFVAVLPGLAEVKELLVNLESLPGYADAWATSAELKDNGTYTATFILNVNSDVAERRFFTAQQEEAPATDASSSPNTESTEGEG